MMAAYDLIPIMAKLLDCTEANAETVYRRLNEAELAPRSAGRARAMLNSRHVGHWTFAILADVPSRAAAEAAAAYYNLENRVGTNPCLRAFSHPSAGAGTGDCA